MEAVVESKKPSAPGKSPPRESSEDRENDRPTVVPPFDVEEMARRSRSSGPAGAVASDSDEAIPTVVPAPADEFRAHSRTLVDDEELEIARVASMQRSSLLPPALDPNMSAAVDRERPDEDPVLEIEDDEEALDPVDEARMLLDDGDEEGARALIDGFLRRNPAHPRARQIAEQCESALAAKYSKRLGSLTRVPKLAVTVDQLVSLSLDHRAGFLLSFVDGVSSVATILDMSGMSASEVLRTFVDLSERRVITLR
jgi:hypothetical protein